MEAISRNALRWVLATVKQKTNTSRANHLVKKFLNFGWKSDGQTTSEKYFRKSWTTSRGTLYLVWTEYRKFNYHLVISPVSSLSWWEQNLAEMVSAISVGWFVVLGKKTLTITQDIQWWSEPVPSDKCLNSLRRKCSRVSSLSISLPTPPSTFFFPSRILLPYIE